MIEDKYENPRVKIEFDFDYYEDSSAIKDLMSHRDYSYRLFDIYNLVRTELKHGNEELSDHIVRLLEDIKEMAYVEIE